MHSAVPEGKGHVTSGRAGETGPGSDRDPASGYGAGAAPGTTGAAPSPAPTVTDTERLEAELERLRGAARQLRKRLNARFFGQEETVERLILALMAGGHVLLEGAPGLGKTTLVHALAEAVDLQFQRLQCTPDLMPSDVLGTRVLRVDDDSGARSFDFEKGPVFTNVLLADEVNRATPRTQSALLEAMQERQVTLHGKTHRLEPPFFMVATQNPIEMEGTYPLPEAQLDRFLFKLELELPGHADLTTILSATTGEAAEEEPPSFSRAEWLRLQELVREVAAPAPVVEAVSAIVLATHPDHGSAPEDIRSNLRYGSSLRGGQAILLAAKARALLADRLNIDLDDVRAVAPAALRHRLILSYEGEARGVPRDSLVEAAVTAAVQA